MDETTAPTRAVQAALDALADARVSASLVIVALVAFLAWRLVLRRHRLASAPARPSMPRSFMHRLQSSPAVRALTARFSGRLSAAADAARSSRVQNPGSGTKRKATNRLAANSRSPVASLLLRRSRRRWPASWSVSVWSVKLPPRRLSNAEGRGRFPAEPAGQVLPAGSAREMRTSTTPGSSRFSRRVKPSSWHIASIVVFSRRTSPNTSPMPRERAYSMIWVIST